VFFCGQLSGSACFRLMKSCVRPVFFGDRYDAGDDSKRILISGSLLPETLAVIAILNLRITLKNAILARRQG
ncbi:MAG: hypothetical protein E7K65_16955, partial [Pseudomonas sp.]|nr:hypothetical protein [Pseudomonas sp.]